MSGYLMRLVMRGRAASEAQSIQPFVRSTSPVAERDQRIGMMGLEGFEFGAASLAEAGSEQEDILQPPVPSGIPAASDPAGITAQRRMSSPIGGPPSPTFETVPQLRSRAPIPLVAKPPLNPPLAKGGRQGESLAKGETFGSLPLAKGEGWGGGQGRGQAETTVFQRDAVETHAGISSHAGPQGDTEPDQLKLRRGDVDMRSVRSTRPVDSARLEPSPRALDEPTPGDTATFSAEANEGPRVVIGRINVEVVPPPAAPPSTAAPRPGPLTAASASVIGPLGGGVPVDRHLSLRYR